MTEYTINKNQWYAIRNLLNDTDTFEFDIVGYDELDWRKLHVHIAGQDYTIDKNGDIFNGIHLKEEGMNRNRRDPFALDNGFARRYQRRQARMRQMFVLIPVLFVSAAIVFLVAYKSTIKEVTFTVQSKESVTVPTGDTVKNQYRVYTDHGVYVVEDTWIFFNFRSADRYASLIPGHTYTCKQAG